MANTRIIQSNGGRYTTT